MYYLNLYLQKEEDFFIFLCYNIDERHRCVIGIFLQYKR